MKYFWILFFLTSCSYYTPPTYEYYCTVKYGKKYKLEKNFYSDSCFFIPLYNYGKRYRGDLVCINKKISRVMMKTLHCKELVNGWEYRLSE